MTIATYPARSRVISSTSSAYTELSHLTARGYLSAISAESLQLQWKSSSTQTTYLFQYIDDHLKQDAPGQSARAEAGGQ